MVTGDHGVPLKESLATSGWVQARLTSSGITSSTSSHSDRVLTSCHLRLHPTTAPLQEATTETATVNLLLPLCGVRVRYLAVEPWLLYLLVSKGNDELDGSGPAYTPPCVLASWHLQSHHGWRLTTRTWALVACCFCSCLHLLLAGYIAFLVLWWNQTFLDEKHVTMC